MPWDIVRSNRFKQRYNEKPANLRAKVDEAIKLLVESDDPRNLGRRKYGSLEGTYGHDIDFRNRILFMVDLVKREIHFLRVCSHKEVYGSS
jgi:mRNA-degrading endonuclease RelE of RelBE toxin-antitoxin system